jgi:hypothetical protein
MAEATVAWLSMEGSDSRAPDAGSREAAEPTD